MKEMVKNDGNVYPRSTCNNMSKWTEAVMQESLNDRADRNSQESLNNRVDRDTWG